MWFKKKKRKVSQFVYCWISYQGLGKKYLEMLKELPSDNMVSSRINYFHIQKSMYLSILISDSDGSVIISWWLLFELEAHKEIKLINYNQLENFFRTGKNHKYYYRTNVNIHKFLMLIQNRFIEPLKTNKQNKNHNFSGLK